MPFANGKCSNQSSFLKTTINFIFVTAGFPLNALITGMFNKISKKTPTLHYVQSTVENKVFSSVCSYMPLIKDLTIK